MTKIEVLAKVVELGRSSVQEIEGATAYNSVEDADAGMQEIKDHLAQLVVEGEVSFIAPGPGEVEKWEVI